MISLTSVVADLQQEVKELRSKLTSNPGLKDNHDKLVKQNHNNKLLQPSSKTQNSDAEVTTENDFHLFKRQQRKLNNGSQTIPNSFPGIKGESASGHSFRATSTIPLLRPVFIGNAHHETTEDDIRKHVTSIGLADGLSDVQTLPSTIAGRTAFCVTFNDHITEEMAYRCDWPNRVIVRPYRPPRKKNIHEPGSNGQYNHGNRQGNGNKMALRRGNNNKRYNNNHGHYNNHNNNHNNTTTTTTTTATTTDHTVTTAAATTTINDTINMTLTTTITTSVVTTTTPPPPTATATAMMVPTDIHDLTTIQDRSHLYHNGSQSTGGTMGSLCH